MATAARPLRDKPTSARVTSTPSQVGIRALSRVNSAAENNANTITGLRPKASEMGPVISRPMASIAVATDKINLWAGQGFPLSPGRTAELSSYELTRRKLPASTARMPTRPLTGDCICV